MAYASAATLSHPISRPPQTLRRANAIQNLLIVLWFLVTFTTFPRDELLLYPLAGYFFLSFLLDRQVTFPLMAKCWPLLLFPLWQIVTVPFVEVPAEALRSAILLLLTVTLAVLLAARFTPRQIVLAVLAASGLCAILSLFITSYHDGAMTGIFAHKNMLGAKMLLLVSASVCTMLDRHIRRGLRIFAAALLGLAFLLILASHSATALVLALGIFCVTLGANFVAGQGTRTPPDRIAFVFLLAGVLGAAAPVILSSLPGSPFALLLESLGKSSTLTGRTQLWSYAEDVIRQRPYIGVGERGFWRYSDNDLVREIFAEFHKNPNQIFSFHNSFYEIAVHQGLIGLAIALPVALWSIVRIITLVFRHGGMPFIFFLTVVVVETIRAMVESEMMKPLLLANILIWIGAIYASKYPGRHRRRRGAR